MSNFEREYYNSQSTFPKHVPCVVVEGECYPVNSIETLNIEEDPSGRDLLTFNWKGKQKQSFVVLKYM